MGSVGVAVMSEILTDKPCVSQHGGVVERRSALGVLLVHISCVLEQELTGDK